MRRATESDRFMITLLNLQPNYLCSVIQDISNIEGNVVYEQPIYERNQRGDLLYTYYKYYILPNEKDD